MDTMFSGEIVENLIVIFLACYLYLLSWTDRLLIVVGEREKGRRTLEKLD